MKGYFILFIFIFRHIFNLLKISVKLASVNEKLLSTNIFEVKSSLY